MRRRYGYARGLRISLFTISIILNALWGAFPAQAGQEELNLCRSQMIDISRAIKKYYLETKSSYPETLMELQDTYLKRIPSCPMGGEYLYTVDNGRKRYTIECRGWAHRDVIGKSHPIFISNHETLEILPEPTPPHSLDREVRKVQLLGKFAGIWNAIRKNPSIIAAMLIVGLTLLCLWMQKRKSKRDIIKKIEEQLS